MADRWLGVSWAMLGKKSGKINEKEIKKAY